MQRAEERSRAIPILRRRSAGRCSRLMRQRTAVPSRRSWSRPSRMRGRMAMTGDWRKMNLAIRGIEGQIAHGDTFHNDQFPDLKADFIPANPPFNVSDWGGERLREDKRWQCCVRLAAHRSVCP